MSMWLLVEERAFLSMQETLNLAQTNSRQVKGFLFNPSKKLERQCDDSKTSPTSASVNCVLEYNVFFSFSCVDRLAKKVMANGIQVDLEEEGKCVYECGATSKFQCLFFPFYCFFLVCLCCSQSSS